MSLGGKVRGLNMLGRRFTGVPSLPQHAPGGEAAKERVQETTGTSDVQTAPGPVCSLQRHPPAEGGCLSGLAGLTVGRRDHEAFSGGKDESRMWRETLSLKKERVFRPVLWSHPLTPLLPYSR